MFEFEGYTSNYERCYKRNNVQKNQISSTFFHIKFLFLEQLRSVIQKGLAPGLRENQHATHGS